MIESLRFVSDTCQQEEMTSENWLTGKCEEYVCSLKVSFQGRISLIVKIQKPRKISNQTTKLMIALVSFFVEL